jgi:hypothetical protein
MIVVLQATDAHYYITKNKGNEKEIKEHSSTVPGDGLSAMPVHRLDYHLSFSISCQ